MTLILHQLPGARGRRSYLYAEYAECQIEQVEQGRLCGPLSALVRKGPREPVVRGSRPRPAAVLIYVANTD